MSSNAEGDDALANIYNAFKHCLHIDKSTCPYKNVRMHNADIRQQPSSIFKIITSIMMFKLKLKFLKGFLGEDPDYNTIKMKAIYINRFPGGLTTKKFNYNKDPIANIKEISALYNQIDFKKLKNIS